MKSPSDLAGSLLRQWRDGARREERLVDPERSFPVGLQIGTPPSRAFGTEPAVVGAHLTAWREVTVGEVAWDSRSVRGLAEPVRIPVRWSIRSVDEWMAAVDAHAPAGEEVSRMRAELAALSRILAAVPPRFNRYLVRQLSLAMATGTAETIRVAEVAGVLEPGQADGLPLRALPMVGADTKFFKRNERMLTALLDVRFDDRVSAVWPRPVSRCGTPEWAVVAGGRPRRRPAALRRAPPGRPHHRHRGAAGGSPAGGRERAMPTRHPTDRRMCRRSGRGPEPRMVVVAGTGRPRGHLLGRSRHLGSRHPRLGTPASPGPAAGPDGPVHVRVPPSAGRGGARSRRFAPKPDSPPKRADSSTS